MTTQRYDWVHAIWIQEEKRKIEDELVVLKQAWHNHHRRQRGSWEWATHHETLKKRRDEIESRLQYLEYLTVLITNSDQNGTQEHYIQQSS